MFNAEHLQEKWAPILDHNEIEAISDKYRKSVTSVLLENQERFLKEERGIGYRRISHILTEKGYRSVRTNSILKNNYIYSI